MVTRRDLPNTGGRRAVWVFLTLVALALAAMVMERERGRSILLIGSTMVILYLFFAYKALTAGLDFDAQGITAHGPVLTRRVRWADIGGIEVSRGHRLRARLRDGRVLTLQSYPILWSSQVFEAQKTLEGLLAARESSGDAAGCA